MPQLETLEIAFSRPFPNRDVAWQLTHTPITTHVTLPNLRQFLFRGVTAYLEAVVRRVTAPSLKKFRILFFEQLTFSVPLLPQFMHTTENLRFSRGKFQFFDDHVAVKMYPREETRMDAFSIYIDCRHLDWQVSFMAQISNSLSQVFFPVEHLALEHGTHKRSSEEHNEVDRTMWRKLLRSFRSVKTLRIDYGLSDEVFRSLRSDGGEPRLLPELQDPTSLDVAADLTDGYISHTFAPQVAEYFSALFKIDNTASVEAIRDPVEGGIYFVFNQSSSFRARAPLTINGRDAWVLDYNVRFDDSVVDRRRYVDQTQFRMLKKNTSTVIPQSLWPPLTDYDYRYRITGATLQMPIYFLQQNGVLGLSLDDAINGRCHILRDSTVQAQFGGKTTMQIRIRVCSRWPSSYFCVEFTCDDAR